MISPRSRYALRALICLAESLPRALTTEQIAAATQVPVASLAKVLQILKRARIVATHRGVGGGISLLVQPEQLSVFQIFTALEPGGVACIPPVGGACDGVPLGAHQGRLFDRLETVRVLQERVLHETTLQDLLTDSAPHLDRARPSIDVLLRRVRDWPTCHPPRVHVVGHRRSGKTSLIVQLLRHYREQGIRVGTLKHTPHPHQIDQPGKDSFRHCQAGAVAVGILSPRMDALFLPRADPNDEPDRYESFDLLLHDCRLMLVEGGLRQPGIKLEVWRAGMDAPFALHYQDIEILVTNDSPPSIRDVSVWQRDDTRGLASLILDWAARDSPERDPGEG